MQVRKNLAHGCNNMMRESEQLQQKHLITTIFRKQAATGPGHNNKNINRHQWCNIHEYEMLTFTRKSLRGW